MSQPAFAALVAYLERNGKPVEVPRLRLFRKRLPPKYPYRIRHGLAPAIIDTFEARRSVRLPASVRASYELMDGMDDYTDVDASWMRFLPLHEWSTVAAEFPQDASSHRIPLSTSFIFADHGIAAWFYAVDLAEERHGLIYSLEPIGSRQVATTFSEFVELVLSDAEVLFQAAG